MDGQIRELVEKVGAIQAKHGPFAAAFFVGDVFDEDDEQAQALLDGRLTRT